MFENLLNFLSKKLSFNDSATDHASDSLATSTTATTTDHSVDAYHTAELVDAQWIDSSHVA